MQAFMYFKFQHQLNEIHTWRLRKIWQKVYLIGIMKDSLAVYFSFLTYSNWRHAVHLQTIRELPLCLNKGMYLPPLKGSCLFHHMWKWCQTTSTLVLLDNIVFLQEKQSFVSAVHLNLFSNKSIYQLQNIIDNTVWLKISLCHILAEH